MENLRFNFRAWDKVAKVMLKVAYIGLIDKVVWLHSNNLNSDDELLNFKGNRWQDKNGSYIDIDFEDVELMLSTGIKDKNEKEIYEGDIIKEEIDYYPMVFIVELNDISASFVLREIGVPDYYCRFNDELDSFEFEVIGNIYENVELLK